MRIMIADTDLARADRINRALQTDPRLRVAGHFSNLTDCYHAVEHRPPAIVLVSAAMAQAIEFEVMTHLFDALSVKWILLGTHRDAEVFNARSRPKRQISSVDPHCAPADLCRNIIASVVRSNSAAPDFRHAPRSGTWDRLFLIGSSTGGVDALMTVLGTMPADCPPVMIVQHTGEGFSAGLARLLDNNCRASVREARDGDLLERGTVLLAPSGRHHMKLDMTRGARCKLVEGPAVSGHRPSVDVLFRSALPVARRCVATILTGMGRDGAEGLLELRRSGAVTLGQNEETSMVYGMPKVAFDIGAVETQHPLSQIGPQMLSSTRGRAA